MFLSLLADIHIISPRLQFHPILKALHMARELIISYLISRCW